MTSTRFRRSSWWAAVAALLLVILRPGFSLADGDAAPMPAGSHLIKIGPQATVVVDEHGNVNMYDDPAEEAPACKNTRQCWGRALGILAFFGVLTYEELTTGVDSSSRALQRVGPPE